MVTIKVPETKFKIGDKITEIDPDGRMDYVVYDISYSVATNDWYYRYSYWEGGYEHYCKLDISWVDEHYQEVGK